MSQGSTGWGTLWYISRNGTQAGPFDEAQIQEFFKSGRIDRADLIWRSDWPEWRPASGVIAMFAPQPPPLPTALPSSPTAPSSSLWPKLALILPVCAAISGLLDFLKPVTEGFLGIDGIAAYFWAGVIGLAVCPVLARITSLSAWHSQLAVGTLVSVVMTLCGAYPVIGGWLDPSIKEKGVIAASSSAVANAQAALMGVERKLESIDRSIEKVDKTGRSIDASVKRLQEANDPQTIARRAIEIAGLSLDNASYIRAVATGSEAAPQFLTVGIRGDEPSLRAALLRYPIGTTEFQNLSMFMQNAPSDSFGGKVRSELKAIIDGVRKSNSLDDLRKITCGPQPGAFGDRLMHANLSSHCAEDITWFNAATSAIMTITTFAVGPAADPTLFSWAHSAIDHMKYHPVSPKQISLSELLSRMDSRGPNGGEFYRTDLYVEANPSGNNLAVFRDAAAKSPVRYVPANGEMLRGKACESRLIQSVPSCLARVTFYNDERYRNVRVISFEVLQTIGAASGPNRK